MSKENAILLSHILRAITEVEEFTEGGQNDHKTLMAVRKEIEIIGEAAKNISEGLRSSHPEIPWRQIIATRHKLSHEYFGVNAKVVWQIVEHELPQLKQQIVAILKQEKL